MKVLYGLNKVQYSNTTMNFCLSKGYEAGGYTMPGLSNGYGAGNIYL